MKTICLHDAPITIEMLEKLTKMFEPGDIVIAWRKRHQESTAIVKRSPDIAEVIGVYNRIIRTTLGDYTVWQLLEAEREFNTGGYKGEWQLRLPSVFLKLIQKTSTL